MVVTVSGISISDKEEQQQKLHLPMVVTPLGIFILINILIKLYARAKAFLRIITMFPGNEISRNDSKSNRLFVNKS